jgi:hypothetical protein
MIIGSRPRRSVEQVYINHAMRSFEWKDVLKPVVQSTSRGTSLAAEIPGRLVEGLTLEPVWNLCRPIGRTFSALLVEM